MVREGARSLPLRMQITVGSFKIAYWWDAPGGDLTVPPRCVGAPLRFSGSEFPAVPIIECGRGLLAPSRSLPRCG